MSKIVTKECAKCNQKLMKKEVYVTCDSCKKLFHGECARMGQDELKEHFEMSTVWKCKNCLKIKKTRKVKKRAIMNGTGDHEIPVENYKSVLARIDAQDDALSEEVEAMSQRLDIIEQATKKNILEITGVPDKKGENVMSIVKQIGTAVDFNVKDAMIDTCYRINRRQKLGHHIIMVHFVRRFDKESFLKSYRAKKITPRDIGRAGDNRIIIQESLSFGKRHLLLQARNVAKKLEFKGVGIVNGEIFMKKMNNSEPIFIKDVKDLEELLKNTKQ